MRKFLGFSFLAITPWLAPAVQAGSISYSASLGCGNTCVTAFVEWSNFNPGVSFVVVLDNLGDFLFGLNTDPFPENTGQINPESADRQRPESSGSRSDRRRGRNFRVDSSPVAVRRAGWRGPPPAPTSALLAVEDSDHNILGEVTFTSTAPEPATWDLMGVQSGPARGMLGRCGAGVSFRPQR